MAKPSPQNEYVLNLQRLTADQLGAIMGLSASRITQLHREGMPKVRRGTFDLKSCLTWYKDKWASGLQKDKSLLAQRKALMREQTIKIRLENEARQARVKFALSNSF